MDTLALEVPAPPLVNIPLVNTAANRFGVLALWMAANPQALISHSVEPDGELRITASIKDIFFTVGFAASEQGIAESSQCEVILTAFNTEEKEAAP